MAIALIAIFLNGSCDVINELLIYAKSKRTLANTVCSVEQKQGLGFSRILPMCNPNIN